MSDNPFADRMKELIAKEEGDAPPTKAAAAPEGGETAKPDNPEPAAAAAPAEGGEPAKAEGEPAPKAEEIDLTALPPAVRERLERADKLANDLKTYQGRTGHLQRMLNQREKELEKARSAGVPSVQPTQAPSPTPAVTVTAPAPTPTGASATQPSDVADLFATNDWQSLKREYPEFAHLERAFTAQAQQIASLRSSLTSGAPDALVQRLESLEALIHESKEQAEGARWAGFERKYRPQEHVEVTFDPAVGTAIGFQRMSPAFAQLWWSMSQQDRDAVDWNDPDDLAGLFDRLSSATPAPTSDTPAAAPAAQAPARDQSALLAAATPALRTTGVARVPSSQMFPNGFDPSRMRELIEMAQG